MAQINSSSFNVPIRDQVIENTGLISRTWETFFRSVSNVLYYLGSENIFDLANNQVAAADITPLSVDKRYTSHAAVEYVIQRIHSGTELLEAGCFHLVYRPTSLTWIIQNIGSSGPDVSGVTFSVLADGSVQYTSSNIGGTISLSRIIFRIRLIGGKTSLYSKVG